MVRPELIPQQVVILAFDPERTGSPGNRDEEIAEYRIEAVIHGVLIEVYVVHVDIDPVVPCGNPAGRNDHGVRRALLSTEFFTVCCLYSLLEHKLGCRDL